MKLELLVVAWFFMLAIAGCDKNTGEASSTPKTPQARQPATAPQQPVAQLRADNFPVTPQSPSLALSSSETFVGKDDIHLSTTFLNGSGVAWNQALMEMKKRQTPALVSVMARNLDKIKGIAVVSGEAMYAPELRYPVARVLMDCGHKPIADLISVCTSSNLSLKKRVLAARVLRQLGKNGHQEADVERIRAALPSSAELLVFNDLWSLAENDLRVATVLSDQ
ncbi:MAG: hypothetical protein LDL31_09860 [Prosthecobacter sp.]|nr:hypothetical protein [Prosthecobacter sp.]